MAVVRWNFPDGANSDSLTNALAGATANTIGGGVAEISTAQSLAEAGSGKSAHFVKSVTGHQWFMVDGLSTTAYAYDIYVYYVASASNVYLIWAGASSSARSTGVQINGTDHFTLWHSGGEAWEGSVAVPHDTWVRVSVYATCDGTVGTARIAWYLGSSTTPQEDSGTITNLNTQANIDRIRYGGSAASTSTTGTEVYVGSWAYDTSAAGLMLPISTGGEDTAAAPYYNDARINLAYKGEQQINKAYVGSTAVVIPSDG